MNNSTRKLKAGLRRSIAPAMLLLLALFLNGACSTATVGMATSNVPLEGRTYQVLGPAETEVSWFALDVFGLLGVPLEAPPVDEAVKNLLVQKKGDALINIRHSTTKMYFFFIFTRFKFTLKADVVKLQ